jgi:hypothetical protein
MPKIISINGAKVKLGDESGKVTTVPIAALTFAGPKVGDQVEVFKDGSDVIVNRAKAQGVAMPKVGVNKKILAIGGGVIAAIAVIVAAIYFVPRWLDKDLGTASSYPAYYANLKEEKEAFSRALQACNKAAAAKLKSNGVTTEYEWDDLDTIRKGIDSDDDVNYIYLWDVNPTGGDTDYKSYGKRDYDCRTNIEGTNVLSVSIVWNSKD